MKIYLLVISLFTSLLLNAQIKKGATSIGGDLSVYYNDSKNVDTNHIGWKSSSYNFSPSLGWAVKDNVIIGGRLFGSFFNNLAQNAFVDDKGNTIGAGIWMRKYLSVGKSFYLFADAGLSGQTIYRKQTDKRQPGYYYKEKGYAINGSLYPGISYQIRKSLFLEAALSNLISLGYGRTNTEEQIPGGTYNKSVMKNFNLYSSFSNGVPLQVGIRWIIAKK